MEKMWIIGEVSKMTGIPKRQLKYYIERDMIKPSGELVQKGKKYWLYTAEDIVKVRQITLYRELGYSTDQIKKLITAPDFDWRKVLDEQIDALKDKKRHIENLLLAAECMRYSNETESEHFAWDISDFDNDIDDFALSLLGPESDVSAESNISKINEELDEKIFRNIDFEEMNHYGYEFMDFMIALKDAMSQSEDSVQTQACIESLFNKLQEINYHPQEFLFALRFFSNFSIDSMMDILFSKSHASDYIARAIQIYCDTHVEKGGEREN